MHSQAQAAKEARLGSARHPLGSGLEATLDPFMTRRETPSRQARPQCDLKQFGSGRDVASVADAKVAKFEVVADLRMHPVRHPKFATRLQSCIHAQPTLTLLRLHNDLSNRQY